MDTGDDEMLHVIKESFQLLFTKKPFEPLSAEPYTYILMNLKLQEEAEAFLEKYIMIYFEIKHTLLIENW